MATTKCPSVSTNTENQQKLGDLENLKDLRIHFPPKMRHATIQRFSNETNYSSYSIDTIQGPRPKGKGGAGGRGGELFRRAEKRIFRN
jgi:hypothetical protein